jgi:hypothetical protein
LAAASQSERHPWSDWRSRNLVIRQRFGGRAMKAGAACGQVLVRYSIFARPLITRRCFPLTLTSRFALLKAQG